MSSNLHDSLTVKALRILPAFKAFRSMYKFLQNSQYWSQDQLEDYQFKRLSKLLNHAYENVPYYRRVFDDGGLKPKYIKDFSDLKKLPVLTKEIIRKNLNDLQARNYPEKKLEYVTTGGSTGTPLGFYYEKGVSRAIEMAFMITLWKRVGYRFRDKCIILRGYTVKSANQGKFWDTAMFGRWLILSSYHMTDDNLPKYVEKIRKFKSKYIQAYPSAITILARYMKENNIEAFPTVKAFLCSSENLYAWQRELLEDVFQCRAFSWYGLTEQTVLAGECEVSSNYHIFPEYGIVELIGKNGEPVTKDGENGEIITTGLNNFAMPFIRYRTEDIGVFSNSRCKCNRNYSLLKDIEGRLQEFIVANDGSMIPLGPAIFGIHETQWTKIKQIQFVQEKPGELEIRVVKSPFYSETEIESYVLKLFKARLEGRCKLKVTFLDHIPPTRSGKHRFLIQKIMIEFTDHYRFL